MLSWALHSKHRKQKTNKLNFIKIMNDYALADIATNILKYGRMGNYHCKPCYLIRDQYSKHVKN